MILVPLGIAIMEISKPRASGDDPECAYVTDGDAW